MSGLGGLNKSTNGVVIGLVQLQLPVVVTPSDLAATTRICAMVARTAQYADHGRGGPVVLGRRLSMDTNPHIMCRLDGLRSPRSTACVENRIWDASSWSSTHGNPFRGITMDDKGDIRLATAAIPGAGRNWEPAILDSSATVQRAPGSRADLP
jgi:formamidase